MWQIPQMWPNVGYRCDKFYKSDKFSATNVNKFPQMWQKIFYQIFLNIYIYIYGMATYQIIEVLILMRTRDGENRKTSGCWIKNNLSNEPIPGVPNNVVGKYFPSLPRKTNRPSHRVFNKINISIKTISSLLLLKWNIFWSIRLLKLRGLSVFLLQICPRRIWNYLLPFGRRGRIFYYLVQIDFRHYWN